jgi:hypothetical protein
MTPTNTRGSTFIWIATLIDLRTWPGQWISSEIHEILAATQDSRRYGFRNLLSVIHNALSFQQPRSRWQINPKPDQPPPLTSPSQLAPDLSQRTTYRPYILEALVELGGKGKTKEVIAAIRPETQVLSPALTSARHMMVNEDGRMKNKNPQRRL